MPPSVIVYQVRAHNRSRVICEAMLEGLRRIGQPVRHKWEDEYIGVESDVALFYGLEGRLSKVFADYSAAAKAVYVDLGYWGRRAGGRWTGYHKLVVNDRHPSAYFQRRPHGPARAAELGVKVQPWRDDSGHILLAGMGDKGAHAEGYEPERWERSTIAELRQYTRRQIVYRPKPSWKGARPIQGIGYSSPKDPVEKHLENCYAVVTHHSNVAVDGLVAGVPAFVWRGVGVSMGSQDLSQIDNPHRPDGREQWVNDIAHCQYSIDEMRRGLAWRYLRDEGLI